MFSLNDATVTYPLFTSLQQVCGWAYNKIDSDVAETGGMQINVSQLLKAPLGTTRDYEVSEVIDVAEGGNGCLVQGNIRLLRTHRSVLVKGILHTDVKPTCNRCLSLLRYPLSLNIEEEYMPAVDVVNWTPLPSPEDHASFTIDAHHILDLTEAIRQYTLLATPMKTLCREECAGLCHYCGHNLNEGPCDCPVQITDLRWSALNKLL